MLVALRPAHRRRTSSPLWLAGIIVNLVTLGDYYDVALRDFGLLVAALALARLAARPSAGDAAEPHRRRRVVPAHGVAARPGLASRRPRRGRAGGGDLHARRSGVDRRRPGPRRTTPTPDGWPGRTPSCSAAPEFDFTTFANDEGYDELVLVEDIPVQSVCEHHLLPFVGVAHIGYLPGERIVGLSKFAADRRPLRRRPQTQERLTTQIAPAPRGPARTRAASAW